VEEIKNLIDCTLIAKAALHLLWHTEEMIALGRSIETRGTVSTEKETDILPFLVSWTHPSRPFAAVATPAGAPYTAPCASFPNAGRAIEGGVGKKPLKKDRHTSHVQGGETGSTVPCYCCSQWRWCVPTRDVVSQPRSSRPRRFQRTPGTVPALEKTSSRRAQNPRCGGTRGRPGECGSTTVCNLTASRRAWASEGGGRNER
jgi:hypothetical protein